jgi:hypothetical protein
VLHNLIELLPLLSGLVAINATDGQKALQSSIDSIRVIGTEELKGQIEESGPLLREIVLQDLLEKRNELGADIGRGRGQGRNQSLTESGLLGFGNGGTLRVVVDRRPTSVDTVLEVDTSWRGGEWLVTKRLNCGKNQDGEGCSPES